MANPNVSESGHARTVAAGTKPKAASSETINGAAIDRMTAGEGGYLSCDLVLNVGDATGSPTSFTADAKLQHSDDGSTGWADITGGAVTQQTAAGIVRKKIDLLKAKRYVRSVVVVAITGGTTPAVPCSSTVILAGSIVKPA